MGKNPFAWNSFPRARDAVDQLDGKMQDPKTLLYRESALYLYDMLCEERGIKSEFEGN